MNVENSHRVAWARAFLAGALLVGVASVSSSAQQLLQAEEPGNNPPAQPAQEQPEVLSRGPVHEAFAEPVNLEYEAGVIAPERPPQDIEEVPPDARPQGQQYAWIPGYWSWDADRRGYIWVSACWRVAPPRMSWVPGYWSPVSGGWEWIAGLWMPAGVQEIEYLPAPPTVADLEPSGVAPSPDTIWVPPCMYWSQGLYVRRSGYWLEAKADWVWMPAHYVGTPRGYIFAAGHWDYSLERRGVLFAPVYFPASVYSRMAFTYSPSIVIDVGLLRLSLFAYPRYSHYYFGDYYDDAYLNIGIFPWFGIHRDRTWYDPVFEHARWSNRRSEPRWEEHGREDYNRRRADTNLRPARTYREQESRVARLPEAQRRAIQVTQPITAVVARRETSMKFERITTDTREKIKKQAVAVQSFGNERNRWETTPASQQKIPHQTPERKTIVTPPAVQRETVVSPPRENRVKQPERVQIPPPPIVGQSGRSGIIFQRGPPEQPANEGNDKDGRDLHKGRGNSR